MSDGPIKREREAWKPRDVSTPDARRVCFQVKGGAGYCGRASARERSVDWEAVTCTDCRAAARADGVAVAFEAPSRKEAAA